MPLRVVNLRWLDVCPSRQAAETLNSNIIIQPKWAASISQIRYEQFIFFILSMHQIFDSMTKPQRQSESISITL